RSYQKRLSSSVAAPSCTTRLRDKSSGSASPRFSRQSWTRAASSWPMMIRTSEPPMNIRRSAGVLHKFNFIGSSTLENGFCYPHRPHRDHKIPLVSYDTSPVNNETEALE